MLGTAQRLGFDQKFSLSPRFSTPGMTVRHQHRRYAAGWDVFIPGGVGCISIDVSHPAPTLICIPISPLLLMHSAPGSGVNPFLQCQKQKISDNHPRLRAQLILSMSDSISH